MWNSNGALSSEMASVMHICYLQNTKWKDKGYPLILGQHQVYVVWHCDIEDLVSESKRFVFILNLVFYMKIILS